MRPGVPDVHITDAQDREFAAYRGLAGQAVVGLLFGLASPSAMVDPVLWAVPVLGAVVGVWALRRIRKSGTSLAGRNMAIAGLTLSLLFAAAAPSEWWVYRRAVCDEARRFTSLWFEYLTKDEPQKAHQLTLPPPQRQPLNDRLWDYYRNYSHQRRELEGYVASRPVRTLLALGPKAQIQFYDVAGQSHGENNDQVKLLYAVTYEEDGEKKSFFVAVRTIRYKFGDGKAAWRILQALGGVHPETEEAAGVE